MAIPCYRPTGQVPRAAAHRRPRGSGRRVGERLLEGAGPLDRLENQGGLIWKSVETLGEASDFIVGNQQILMLNIFKYG